MALPWQNSASLGGQELGAISQGTFPTSGGGEVQVFVIPSVRMAFGMDFRDLWKEVVIDASIRVNSWSLMVKDF